MLFDDHYFLARRVYRLLHTRVFAQRPPSRTVHVVSNVEVGELHDDGARPELAVYSAQVVYEIRPGSVQQYGLGDPRVMAGRCEHRLVTGEDGIKIAFKKFELYDRDQPIESLAFLV